MNISKILWAILAGIVMLWVGGGTPAEAHHPIVVSSDYVCTQDGSWSITWTASPDATRGLTWWLTSPTNTSATPVPDTQAIQFQTTAPGSATGANVSVSARWSNNATGTRTGSVQFDGRTCTTTTTSSTTTTTEPEETTTTTTEVEQTTTTVQDTTTTLNETTTTVQQPTTIPPITGPATVPSTTPIPDECWIDDNPNTAIPAGSFTFYDTGGERAIGTHSISGQPCGPTGVGCYLVRPCVPDIVYTTPPPTPTGTLPETGTSSWTLVALATAMLGAGAFAMKVARR